MTAQPWWDERIAGAFMSYWLYQHLGNLSPAELRADPLYTRAQREQDAGPLLKEFALNTDRGSPGARWSYHRRLGGAALVVVDSRAGRVLRGGRREMVDDAEWAWLEQRLRGDVDHLLIATSLPFLLPPAIHNLEAWNEALCAGAWGARAARAGERLRRAIDLEHWASFRSSFERFAGVLREVAGGERGAPPASIVFLSGDVHYSYLAEATLGAGNAEATLGGSARTRVYQAVCSPFRHSLDPPLQLANRIACRPITTLGTKLLTWSARVPKPPIRWRLEHGPCFENDLATLELNGRSAALRVERTPTRELRLEPIVEVRLT
jgi:hypothetical protein